ncbi:MAG: helix-turn-helix domain-containing protein [Halolamina sp.]|uniref:winged helix-turn-helix domain-containing protein n=1 Tax=Halolamina sp. TaxID=1940283 RepID=UPI002FC35EEB
MSEGVDRSIEAFDLLSDELRLDILRTLGEAMAGDDEIPMSFSELQRRVGVEDNGRFNYHLTKLVGGFVRKVDGGYKLRPPGISVYQAIISGAYIDEGDVEPTQVEGEFCNDCQAAGEAWYENSQFHLGCVECGKLIIHYPIPPGSFDRDEPESMLTAGSAWILRDQVTAQQGVCPYCAGTVEATLSGDDSGMSALGKRKYTGVVSFDCRRCSWVLYCNPPFAISTDPVVIGFFSKHDIDVFDRHPWTTYPDAEERILSRDPWRVEVRYHVDDVELHVTIDENTDIIDASEVTPERAE